MSFLILTLICLRENAHRNEVFKHIQGITFRQIRSPTAASHLHFELIAELESISKQSMKNRKEEAFGFEINMSYKIPINQVVRMRL